MVRKVNDSALDAQLTWVKDNTDAMWIISNASAGSNYDSCKNRLLASAAAASTIFTLGDGDVSGRKMTVAVVSGVVVVADGTATHVALVNVSASSLTYITESSAQVLASGNTLTTTAWDIETRDPTAP